MRRQNQRKMLALLAGVLVFGAALARADDGGGKAKPDIPQSGYDLRLIFLPKGKGDLPLSEAVMIGDKPADIEAGRRVGARTVLVRTGEGRETERRNGFTSDFAGDDLNVAVDWILTHPNA